MWFWYGLLAALAGAFCAVFNKRVLKHVHAPLLTWSLFSLTLPLVALLAINEGGNITTPQFFIGVTGSALAFVVGKTLKNDSVKRGDLSRIAPLTVFGSLFTYVLGLIFLSESLTFLPLVGLILILTGAYVLNADEMNGDIFRPIKQILSERIALVYIVGMLLSSVSAVFDKIGLKSVAPSGASLTLLFENLIMTAILTGYLVRQEPAWIRDLREHFWELLFNSGVYTVVSLFTFYGFIGGPVVLVQGIKRLDVLFTIVLSLIFFGDRPTKHTWFATALMLTGTVLTKL